MMKILALLCLATIVAADFRSDNERNLDLYKYDPSDIYSLPEDIDEELPAIVFQGDVMKAKVDKLENFSGNKKYKLDLRTQNGIQVSSVGKLKDDKTFVVSGSYSFTGADGRRYRTRYTADERGYHPITELDLDIPEPQPTGAASNSIGVVEKALFGGPKNRFQFLNQNLNLPSRGSGQSGDDYSYAPEPAASENVFETYSSHSESGYDYSPPAKTFEPSRPERQYLPSV